MNGKQASMKSRSIALAIALALSLAANASAQTSVYRSGSYISGSADEQEHFTPVEVPGEVIALASSDSASYALTREGKVYAWGNNAAGQLGDGNYTSSPYTPVEVHLNTHIIAVGENNNGAVAIDSEGHAWGWGANINGSECSKGAQKDQPLKVSSPVDFVAAAGGGRHMILLATNGAVYACGSNDHGMSALGKGVITVSKPTLVPGLPPIAEISIGGDYDAFRTASGELYTAGENSLGQCGVNSKAPAIWTAEKVNLEGVQQVSAGGDTGNGAMLALTSSGPYGWGDDEKGEIGNGIRERGLSYDSPQRATAIESLPLAKVVTGGANSFALTTNGTLYGFGSDQGSPLGFPGPGSYTEPQPVEEGVKLVISTARNSLAIH